MLRELAVGVPVCHKGVGRGDLCLLLTQMISSQASVLTGSTMEIGSGGSSRAQLTLGSSGGCTPGARSLRSLRGAEPQQQI